MKTFLFAFVAVAFMSAGSAFAQQRAALGITMRDLPTGSVSITNVVANSPAAQIGLLSGDRILSISNQPAASSADVERIIGGMQPGATIELMVARGAWQGKLSAVLGTSTNVFSPNRQFVTAAPAVVRTSTSTYTAPAEPQSWQFPNNMFDNGQRGMMAAFGGLGY